MGDIKEGSGKKGTEEKENAGGICKSMTAITYHRAMLYYSVIVRSNKMLNLLIKKDK
jgi:hypothetical protein